eukprot:gnl/MRDRNA2_/MRDRNA2_91083_c0_seq1.p1 gnl/MRDRNA2_/MRDRNA2_91083_c0~~gnl/MRDRNA2_/MRDRNA2_91083_c0_seq1.p1  ORF type:complete len:319 (+),score=67.09 gnl/MRDRNA2_/MRDRNA2_91083_c0_seq1:106-1062(+)
MALPESAKLVICVAGIWSCFLAYGVLQEGIWRFKTDSGEKFSQTMLLLVLEHGVCSVVSFFFMVVLGQTSKQEYTSKMIKQSSIVAVSQCAAKFSSNESLKHVSYPIQALAKSSKTIPAMFGSFFSGKKFSTIQWIAAFTITVGCAVFSMSGKKAGGGIQASAFGVMLLVCSLLGDGFVAYFQDGMRGYAVPLTAYEQMFMTNFGAAVFLLPAAVISGQLASGAAFVAANPAIIQSIGIFAACSAAGQVFIFATIVWFGPDVNAKITTLRKMFTVLISIVWYGHPMGMQQWISVGFVFTAVLAELAEKAFAKPKEKKT